MKVEELESCLHCGKLVKVGAMRAHKCQEIQPPTSDSSATPRKATKEISSPPQTSFFGNFNPVTLYYLTGVGYGLSSWLGGEVIPTLAFVLLISSIVLHVRSRKEIALHGNGPKGSLAIAAIAAIAFSVRANLEALGSDYSGMQMFGFWIAFVSALSMVIEKTRGRESG